MYGITAIGLTSVLYLVACVSCLRQKDYPHALMWFSYSSANLGLLWYELSKIRGE